MFDQLERTSDNAPWVSSTTGSSNNWRYGYGRPAAATSEAVPEHSSAWERRKKRSRNRQREQQRTTGFAGDAPQVAHAVVAELRKLGNFPSSVLFVAGQLSATGGTWNFQGNKSIAQLGGLSLRTVQRARKRIEMEGWILSYRLAPGEKLPGMKRPVRRHQVVRCVHGLLELARVASRYTPRRVRKSRAAAQTQATPPARNPTCVAAQVTPAGTTFHLADAVAQWLGSTRPPMPAKRESILDPKRVPHNVDPYEIDAWDEQTDRFERGEPLPRPPPSE